MNKLRTYITIGLLLVLTSLVGCRKNYSVVGKVYNAETSEGIEGIEVVFMRNLRANNPEGKPIFTSTNYLGNYRFDLKVRPSRAHKLKITGFRNEDNFFLKPYEQGLVDGKVSQIIDIPFIPIRTVTLEIEDTLKINLSNENKMTATFRHFKGKGYFNPSELPMVQTTPDSYKRAEMRLLQGWNYLDGKSYRNDGTIYNFRDSIFVDVNFEGTQHWHIRY